MLVLVLGLMMSGCGSDGGGSNPAPVVLADWTTYQGNARHDGYVPVTLDPADFGEQWVTDLQPGTYLNPVTTAEGNVFVTTKSYYSLQKMFVVDGATGAVRWTYDFGDIFAVHPPAFGNGTIYVTTGGHEDTFLWGFDPATGTVRFRTSFPSQWERYYAPTLYGDTVYSDGGYYGGALAFNGTNGDLKWSTGLNQYDQWTPAVDDRYVYAYTGDYNPMLSVLNRADGSVALEIPDSGFEWNGWSMDLAPVLGTSGNVLCVQGSRLLSFDVANGRIGWEKKGTYVGQVSVANGVIYVFNNYQVEARRESDGELLWIWIPPVGDTLSGTMIVTNNMLFVSSDRKTYGIDLKSHATVWTYDIPGLLALGRNGVLLVATADGRLASVKVR
jgi:outer membrane protein assembly factor BamB